MKDSAARRVAFTGLLFALALALSVLEGWVTPFFALPPGVKLGLANTVVMFALLFLPKWQALALVVLKAGSALLFRGVMAGALSLAGGLLSLGAMLLLLLVGRGRVGLLLVSVAGAICHNAGQLAVVRLWMGPFALYYMPVLLLAGVAMGLLNAFLLWALLPALQKAGLAGGYPLAAGPGRKDT